nr:hypothetical protein BaRGS_030686 [Batillaria attramentaria]
MADFGYARFGDDENEEEEEEGEECGGKAAFRNSLSNRFQPLQDLIEDSEMDIETHWEHSKKLWHDTCEEVLGKRKTQHKEWISADTIQKLEVRKKKKTALNTSRTRRAKAKAQEEYTAADREVKRSTRKDKRDYIDNLASQAEEAARQGNLKDLYQVTKKLAGKFQQTDKPVKDKNGHPLTTTEEQLKRWAEHFRELLNRPIPETPPDIPPAETELPINCDKPSKAEIRKAIITLRNGKAAGPDEIPAEAIKADTETAVNMLHSLFSKIWEKEEVPAQWKEGIVIKLPKKGDLRDCSNYRGIMLLSVPGKVLNRILLERMREAVDPMLRDQQAGFRRNRSCADQIASLRIIVEQSLEWNSPLYINFIDYEKAFDSVDREALWKLLRHYGVPGKIISLIQCTYQDMSCRIAHAGQLSESFEVKTGVRQGCLLSPFLFLLVIDWIMKTTTAGRKNGIQWTLWTQLDDLDFADDLALLSHSHSQMQDKTTRLEATSAGTGLKINRKKTELMKINTTANTPVTVGGEPIREVESFVYLGSVVDGQGGTDRDVTARIGKARAAMVMLKNVWASKVVSIRTKLRIFNSNVKSVLLYGCETWRTTKTMQQKIQTFLNTCLRRIFNIRWPEKIRNEELWERAGQEPVAKQILRRKWGWIGHTLRKPASSTTRQALTWNPQGKRKRGRPRNSWRRDTEAELSGWKNFDKVYGHSTDYSLSDAFWTCADMFSKCPQSLNMKRVMLFTNNDDPHAGNTARQIQARTKAIDLKNNGIDLELIHLIPPGQTFDVNKFYKVCEEMDEDSGEEDLEGGVPANLNRNQLLAGTAVAVLAQGIRSTYGQDEASEDVVNIQETPDDIRLRAWRVVLDAGFLRASSLVLHLAVAVGQERQVVRKVEVIQLRPECPLYNLVRSCPKPPMVKLSKKDNSELKTHSKTYLPDTVEVLMPQDMKKAQTYGGRRICFENDEVAALRRFGESGLELMGFKPRSSLKPYYHIKPAQFIYPDEGGVSGSTTLFTALLRKCLDRDVVAICKYTPGKNNPPRFVALLPQEEELDEHKVQLTPPGFHIIFLPYADDFRKVNYEEKPRGECLDQLKSDGVQGLCFCSGVNLLGRLFLIAIATEDQVEAAKEVVKKLRFQFSSEAFENPVLQNHWRNIEALALDRDEPDELIDYTMPVNDKIKKKAGPAIREFMDLVFPADYVPGQKKRAAPSESAATKRAKNVDAAMDLDLEKEARAGRLGKLTVAVLRDAIRKANIPCAATRKADLIDAISDFYGV